MAIGDSYIDLADLKDYMSIQGTSYDTRMTSVCAAVSREIEAWCHRQFNQAGTVSSRVYNPTSYTLTMVDDFFTTTGLVIETDDHCDGTFSTAWTAADYQLEPLNGIRNAVPGWPFWSIQAVGFSRRFTSARRANVRVTANWGWAAIPDLVKEAALMLAADTFQTKDSRFGVAGSDQFGNVTRVRDNVVAQSKLKHYVRGRVFVA